METIGLRELRQHASDYVKRAELGESLLITVSGRPSAVLGPAVRRQWQPCSDLAGLFDSGSDPSLAVDLADVDSEPADPWSR